jgi:hypothetical protein
LAPCYRRSAQEILKEVKNLKFGTHIFEGGWRLADGKALSSVGVGVIVPNATSMRGNCEPAADAQSSFDTEGRLCPLRN